MKGCVIHGNRKLFIVEMLISLKLIVLMGFVKLRAKRLW